MTNNIPHIVDSGASASKHRGREMNAYELADELDWMTEEKIVKWCNDVANMLRQQADRIAELEKFFKPAESQLEYENRELQRRIDILEKDLHMLQRHYDQLDHYTTPQTKPLIGIKGNCGGGAGSGGYPNENGGGGGGAMAIEAKVRGQG